MYALFKRRFKASFVITFILYAFLGNLLMIAFGLAGRSFPINSESPIYTDDAQKIAVQMVEGSENNGTTNGITQIISHHQIVAINLQTGEKQWTKYSSSKETLIGNFMGLLVHHRDDDYGKLSLLDIKTGKEKLSEKEFTEKHKQLIDVLDNGSHNIALLQNNLYFEGVDGKFYRFDGKKLSEDNKAETYLSTKFFIESIFQVILLRIINSWRIIKRF
ncbi:PA2928 family protein [Lysinibacillus sp. NPDC093688]|uniref:PA2928 family protein n=1 Tax=Lysinibacillus sp. NPDC093688 TaxID=3390577 RepID=UPI003D044967